MVRFATVADRNAVENEMPYGERDLPRSVYEALTRIRDAHPQRPAISRLFSAPGAPAQNIGRPSWETRHRNRQSFP